MNIAMFTNTFTPHVGGVARSVSTLASGLRDRGHRVLVIAPEFEGMPAVEEDVVRIAAVQRFGGSDFSVPLPLTRMLNDDLDLFRADVIHSHHPFLLGDTALRASGTMNRPIVFTYHTQYELYGHYVIQNSEALQRMVRSLSLGYCELCNRVIAPSESISRMLRESGVSAPISVIPTGIDTGAFAGGNRQRGRRLAGIPDDAMVIGHVGRLAPEKNLEYLSAALALFLAEHPKAWLLVTGDGESRAGMEAGFERAGVAGRVRFSGVRSGVELADCYSAMDLFAFSSKSETQGLVLVEAMAAGLPVVALDASGVREVVVDGENGRLLPEDGSIREFADSLSALASLPRSRDDAMRDAAREAASRFSIERYVDATLHLYSEMQGEHARQQAPDNGLWDHARRSIAQEFGIIGNFARAMGDAVLTYLPERNW